MKKNKKIKKIVFLGLLFSFFIFGITLSFLRKNEIFSEGIILYEPPEKIKSNIDVNEIKTKMNEMSVEEIEKTITEIEKEIKRLELKLN